MTELAKDITRTKEKIRYDTQCKKVLANKSILAWILKYTAEEFRDMELLQIQECIEGEPDISTIRIEPGNTNQKRSNQKNRGTKITGETNEDKILEEGAIYFDIRFSVLLPGKSGDKLKMIINVEAQNKFYPGYDIVTRGIFYAARLISSQLETEFTKSHYDDIKKVYSIWICMNSPEKIGDAISKYSIKKEDLVPGIPDHASGYDKITIVQICLSGKNQENKNTKSELTGMLNLLFDPSVTPAKKIQQLEEQYCLEMETNLGKELNEMCNLSDYIEEIGLEKGRTLTLINLIQKKCRKNKSLQETADELEENIQDIELLYQLVKDNPEKTEMDIFQMMKSR